MQKTVKIILLLFIIISLVNIIFITTSYALDDPNQFKPSGPNSNDFNIVKDKVGYVLGVIRNFSYVLAVIVLMITGVRYIFGSVEEKADYKSSLKPLLIGMVLATSGTTLVSFLYNTFSN